jgi:hypothetical protein
MISRLQHRTNGRYLRGVVGDEMNMHCGGQAKTENLTSHFKAPTLTMTNDCLELP